MSRAVLKAGEARLVSRGMYSLDLRDISQQAAEMLAAARAKAERIVNEARVQSEAAGESIRQAAHRQGYEKGWAEGSEKGRIAALTEARERFTREQAVLVETLTSLVQTFRARREELYLAARRDVVVLAIAIAARILPRLADLGEGTTAEAAVRACEEALGLIRGATEVVVRVHPADRAGVEQLAKEVQQAMDGSRGVRLVEDKAVGRGGVMVETADGEVDARVDARVRRIADELVSNWQERTKALSLGS
jgi:flagellar assembly protein FliH